MLQQASGLKVSGFRFWVGLAGCRVQDLGSRAEAIDFTASSEKGS